MIKHSSVWRNGAKAPSSDGSCNHGNFLHCSGDPTPEMFQWYYGTSSTTIVNVEDIDDRISIISVCEVINGIEKIKSFTIGNSTKREIYRNYMFYHH